MDKRNDARLRAMIHRTEPQAVTASPTVDLTELVGKDLVSGWPQGRIIRALRFSKAPYGIALVLISAGGKEEYAGFLDGEHFTVTEGTA
jgi:hypothetical protein